MLLSPKSWALTISVSSRSFHERSGIKPIAGALESRVFATHKCALATTTSSLRCPLTEHKRRRAVFVRRDSQTARRLWRATRTPLPATPTAC